MRATSTLSSLALFAAGARAHFLIAYPEPRGPHNPSQQINVCSGYNDAATNRSSFPLTGGSFLMSTAHGDFTIGVTLSTDRSPNSLDNFQIDGQDTFVKTITREENAGSFCIPLDIAAANIPGVADGANATLQFVFDGGDGNTYYQCADLTLTNDYTPPADFTCTNITMSADDHDQAHDHGDSEDVQSGSSSPASGNVEQMQHLSGFAAAISLGFVCIVSSLLE